MKKIYIIVIFIAAGAPFVINAAWWNPFSWDDRNPPTVCEPVIIREYQDSQCIGKATEVSTTTSQPVIEVVEKIQKNSYVYIDNPKLQARIDTLEQEKGIYKAGLDAANIQITKLKEEIEWRKAQIVSIDFDRDQQIAVDKAKAYDDGFKAGVDDQVRKETNFFNSLILSDSVDIPQRVCRIESGYYNLLPSFTKACDEYRYRNRPQP